jgi:2-isopropylmalate synthase
MRIFILDSTLHDGTRDDQVSFSVEDRLHIAERLDEFGIDYIDAGAPADPRDREFFERAHDLELKHARLTAFGSIRCRANDVANDPSIKALLEAGTPVVCLSGESWDVRAYQAQPTTCEEHRGAIADCIRFFKDRGREVIYNAENFFDGYRSNPDFALRTLEAARGAGADVICLCDTSGGTLPVRITEICGNVARYVGGVLGIHAHNDSDLAVANAIAAVEAGFTHVQGCMNGYGERCGCANLCSILPNLELKSGHTTVGREKLEHLNALSHFISEMANLSLPGHRPYVGCGAFGHRSAHLESLLDEGSAFDHTRPEYVGNSPQLIFDQLNDPERLLWKVAQFRLPARLCAAKRRELGEMVRSKQDEGYDLAGADGTLELIVRETLYPGLHLFDVLSYEVTSRVTAPADARTCAAVTVDVNGAVRSGTSSAHGPIHALDLALRECLTQVYPAIDGIRLADYKVRVLEPHKGTAAKVRVMIEWTDDTAAWATAGVSDNVLEASWTALTDGVRLALLRLSETHQIPEPLVEDYSWGV